MDSAGEVDPPGAHKLHSAHVEGKGDFAVKMGRGSMRNSYSGSKHYMRETGSSSRRIFLE
jgi:hypothetical protein